MEIIYKEAPGAIYDVFQSLWVACNYEEIQTRKEELGEKLHNEYELGLKNILMPLNTKEFNRFFSIKFEPKRILGINEMWKYDDISGFLNHIEKIDDGSLWDFVGNAMEIISDDEELSFDSKDYRNLEEKIEFINSKKIDNSIKWEMLMLVTNKNTYLKEFTDTMRDYLEVYEELDIKRERVLKDFNKELEGQIAERGLDFFEELVRDVFSFEGYDNLYVTTSALSTMVIADDGGSDCYLILGPYLEEYLKGNLKDENIDEVLGLIKNICERTRFEIIKLLLKGDYYGLEIAGKLGITKATVSYHMDYLVSQKIVSIKPDGQKVYYSLNKEPLRDSLKFLKKQFEL